jgi:hypothetical protein
MDINTLVAQKGLREAIVEAEQHELGNDVSDMFLADLAWALVAADQPDAARFAVRRATARNASVGDCIDALLADELEAALAVARAAPKTAVTSAALEAIETRAVTAHCKVYRGATPKDACAKYGIARDVVPRPDGVGAVPAPKMVMAVAAEASRSMLHPIDRLQ